MFFKCFSCVFASVSDVCFKCFIFLQMYVANVAYGCFKSRLGIASPSLLSVTSPQCFLLLLAPTDIRRPLPIFWTLVTFRGSAGLAWTREMA
jgi:hypothetical protein